MKRNVFLIGLLFCWPAWSGAAEHLGQLKLSAKATELLAGRLTVHVPSEGHSIPLQHSIMAAPESNAEMTRLIFDAGPQRMVMLAQELFARTDEKFESGVNERAATLPTKVKVEPWPLSSLLRAYVYIPLAPTKNKEANLVMGVYVAQTDGTVQELRFFINNEATDNFADALALAKSIARTIAPGSKQLNRAAGDRTLAAYPQLIITVPDGYVVTEQQGVDFLVHHIRKITTFPGPTASIGIYVGDYPSGKTGDMKANGSIKLFGQEVQWYEKQGGEGNQKSILDDVLVRQGQGYLDIFLQAKDAAGIDELKKIVSTLRVGNTHKAEH